MTPPTKKCAVEDCNRKVHARGWCELHWGRWYRTGDPEKVNSPGPEKTLDQWDGVLGQGMSYRQLDYWTRCGYLTANDPAPGNGHRRFWKPEEQAVAARMVRLIAAGVSLKVAARIAREEGTTHDLGNGVTLTLQEAS